MSVESIKGIAVLTAATFTVAATTLLGVREVYKGTKLPCADGIEDGGKQIAKVLKSQGVEHIFVLSGGHVAPVYVESANMGIKVIDVRHEASAVFAADASARLTGLGVAVVTAGPGVTNTVTAVQNAMMAESPVVILGGATSGILKGRGSLQDIDHLSIMKPITKWTVTCSSIKDVGPIVLHAIMTARSGVPGPVFVELPLDVLYPADVTTNHMVKEMPTSNSLLARLTRWYMTRYLTNLLAGATCYTPPVSSNLAARMEIPLYPATNKQVGVVLSALKQSKKPVLVIGSGAMLCPTLGPALAAAVPKLDIPTYVTGMARGLLGKSPPSGLFYRHQRGLALKEADLVLLAGAVCDFRLRYGLAINPHANLISVNRSIVNINMNRRPNHGLICDPATFLTQLASSTPINTEHWKEWKKKLTNNEEAREAEITANGARKPNQFINPITLLKEVNKVIDKDSVIIADGGDFVGTASYILQPRGPLSWLDPGPFGTLGVGGGFGLGAKMCRPNSEVWIIYGDGALGFSIAELDTMTRHKLGIIALVGNDAVWSQMIRDQVRILGSSTACNLSPTRYDKVCEGFGGKGLLLERTEEIGPGLMEAKRLAKLGQPVLVNCRIAKNEFREGALSM